MANSNSRRVYSDEEGRLCPDCGKGLDRCTCRKNKKEAPQHIPSDGIVRLRREVNGRGGKTVIVITGLPLDEKGLKELGGKLKKICGTGGSVKNGVIEIQGEHRERLMAELEKLGYKTKAAGG